MSKQAVIAKAVLTFIGIMAVYNILRSSSLYYRADNSILIFLIQKTFVYAMIFIFARYFIIRNSRLIRKITTDSLEENPATHKTAQLVITLALVLSGLHIVFNLFISGRIFRISTQFYAMVIQLYIDIQNMFNQGISFGIKDFSIIWSLMEYLLLLAFGILLLCKPQKLANKLIESHLADKGEKK